ncbi:NAD+ synthase (glutamine-hydrolysing) [Sporothrix brasiliensis 5110]|uniref:Glutamine-dependent NAD(+) synthetase n=1 Tax=Sporothrix brasiliensis 5110 TaxID=1398154 RepID=A0A0C2IGL6_9PEZI|nr:NAD+ synthase (glutamine-hydrolyzing) [Sporothrix brasiliensis 5110]KIH88351.1 NAD+ synthase (glutamine-hydrolysing) [Sporothrix brasiliensis 5110]
MHLVTLSTCNLNQWALDFEGNTDRIIRSIHEAKRAGAKLRVGPELEVSGYDCLDHFLEGDLYLHCWQQMYRILTDTSCFGILLDIGMPVLHRGNRFNCRVLALDGKIIMIRPKLFLAADGNYRENRYFIAWHGPRHVEEYYLPPMMQDLQGSIKVPIGDAVISTPDTCLGAETCEELFTPNSPHIGMGLSGTEIFTNSSGSHHSLRKLDIRVSLILEATRKNGGVYLYSNCRGAGGERLYYDGCSMIIVNGNIVAQGSQFSLKDVEVITATVDLEEVRSYRFTPSRGMQAMQAPAYRRIEVDFSLADNNPGLAPTKSQLPRYHLPEEEIALGPACYLYDYLRRSGASGFLLPLSGGIDSCSTAVIVFSMCRLAMAAVAEGNETVIADVKRLCRHAKEFPKTPEEFCNNIMHTIYMGMKTQSSKETRQRAEFLARDIGSHHTDINIDNAFHSFKGLLTDATGFEPKFKVYGGGNTENLSVLTELATSALQNIQARSRMVAAYEFAQLLPTVRFGEGAGGLLVLGSANVDECLRGYLTKYDCSSADINPIGSISKKDLKRFIAWAEKEFKLPILGEFLNAVPTAELEPITGDYVQSDEADMGMTYDDLSTFGVLRKEMKLGPYYMFQKLVHDWKEERGLEPRQVAEKVKKFFAFYAINRHKMTTMTPSVHMETYSPDDNRFDHRPFLYPRMWDNWSFKMIDQDVERMEAAQLESREAAQASSHGDN